MKNKDEKIDIFDRIMMLPIFSLFREIYIKHKEVWLYLFFGGLAFIVSIGTFALMESLLDGKELVSNVVSWIITVSFAFVTNKIWVFTSTDVKKDLLWQQLCSFFGGRVITLLLEEAILFLFVTKLEFLSIPVKIIAQMIVILSNYFISKKFVFK